MSPLEKFLINAWNQAGSNPNPDAGKNPPFDPNDIINKIIGQLSRSLVFVSPVSQIQARLISIWSQIADPTPPTPPSGFLLMEDFNHLLLENGSFIKL